MKPADLFEMAETAVARGDGHMILTVPKTGRVGERAALLPGLNGRVLAYDGERATLWMDATAVLRWLKRRTPSTEHATDER
jgi:hypothetical protein